MANRNNRSKSAPEARLFNAIVEVLEKRCLLSAAFDVTSLTAMRADPTFSAITGTGIGVAVLDTGVFAANPDLQSNVQAFFDAVKNSDPTAAADANPIQDAVDPVGHGSHTSGIVASSNPAIGVAYGAKLVDVRVLPGPNEQRPSWDGVTVGLQWVFNHAQQYNIKVVSMSLGSAANFNAPSDLTQVQQDAETQAIQQLQGVGITVVSSAGNGYVNYNAPGESFPAAVSTIAVGNTFDDAGQAGIDLNEPTGGAPDTNVAFDTQGAVDQFAGSSQRSTLPNFIVAPGTGIYSTWNGTQDTNNGNDLNHNYDSGTSMSAPFVSGTVALMQNAAQMFGGRYLTPDEVLNILKSSADTITDASTNNNYEQAVQNNMLVGNPLDLPETGLQYPRVNVLKAMQAVQALVQKGNVVPPVVGPGNDTNSTEANAIVLPNVDGTQVLSVDGNIGNDGQVAVGNNDIDLYKVQLDSLGDLSIALSLPSGGTSFGANLARL